MRDFASQSWLLVVALMSISCATGIRDGTMPDSAPTKIAALTLLTIGIVALAVWIGRTGAPACRNRCTAAPLIAALVGVFAFQFFKFPTILRLFAPSSIPMVMILMAAGILAAIAGLLRPDRGRFLLTMLVLGCGTIAWTVIVSAAIHAHVETDVQLWQERAGQALRDGTNPYSVSMPDMYGTGSRFYAPGMTEGGEVKTGYPYPPITVLLAASGQLVGDVRWPLVLVAAISGCMLAWMRRSAGATASAAIFFFAMPALFILPLGYTDIYVAGGLIATVWCACRFPRAVPILLGVLLGTKQYAVVLLPAMMLLAPRPWSIGRAMRWFWPAVVVAGLLVLPPFLIDFGSAWRSMVMFHFHQPFRSDSLGYLPLLGQAAGGRASPIVPWIALLLATVLIWKRSARSPGGFCTASALLIAVFFAFGKQAFANYYFFVIACLCAGIASGDFSTAAAAPRQDARSDDTRQSDENWTMPVSPA